MKLAILAAAAVGVVLSGGTAAAVTFDFTGLTNATQPSPKVFTSEGLLISVSADSLAPGAAIAESPSPGFFRGLGVVDSVDSFSSIEVGQTLSFSIPTGFQVSSITVARRGGAAQTAEFTLFDGGFVVGTSTELLETLNSMASDGRETVSIVQGGSLLSVSSASGNTGGIWVNEIVYDPLPTNVVAVSLPPSLVILGSALGLGALLGWRRRSKTA